MQIKFLITLFMTPFSCLFATACLASPDIKSSVLSTHNHLRAQHQAPNLVWDDTLADYARNHASHCEFKHSHSPYGENLAAGYPSINAAIQAWYSEQAIYSYKRAAYQPEAGHFTQLVWKSSKKIGCAYVACEGKNGTPGNYLVCEYSPAGNVVNKGYFRENVIPKS